MLPATEADALELAPILRKEDLAEIEALSGRDPSELLVESVRMSVDSFTVRVDGKLMCVGGCAAQSLIGRTGIPWMMGTQLVREHPRYFLPQSRAMVARWLTQFPVLRNVVDARYEESIRWLGWLGFNFGEPTPMGVSGLPFLPFEMEA